MENLAKEIHQTLFQQLETIIQKELKRSKLEKTSNLIDSSTQKYGYKKITKRGVLP